MDKIVEICCGSFYDAKQAYLGGAKRIELNSALYLGGLTPSLATLDLTKKSLDLKVIAMVRPRAAGFNYSSEDFSVMKNDCEFLLKYGADGIAFGCLDENKQVDIKQVEQIINIIKKYNKEAVFHRAFDCVSDPFSTIEILIQMGIDRILTSGLQSKAIDGIDLIKQLQQKYGDKIEILAGSGVNASNAKKIMETANIYQVHSSCKDWLKDNTTSCENVSYSYADEPFKDYYDVVSKELVQNLIESIQ